MKAVFYRQDFVSTTQTTIALFWMFVLPGYALTHYWRQRMDFGERVVIGIAMAAGITAVASYYLGLTGFPMKLHGIVLPIAMLLFSAAIFLNGKGRQQKQDKSDSN